MQHARLMTADGRELARVELAVTARQRARGLLGKTGLAPGSAMWLAPGRSIHTVGMRFAIDVVFLDRELRVVTIREAVVPFRLVWGGWRAHGVLEFAAGEVARLQIAHGQQFLWQVETV
ncbi:MAG: DUF192 domain-containing protein [Vicinamibacterales bacterium]